MMGFIDFLSPSASPNTLHPAPFFKNIVFCFPSIFIARVCVLTFLSVCKACLSFVRQERYSMPCYRHFLILFLSNPSSSKRPMSFHCRKNTIHIPVWTDDDFNYTTRVLLCLTRISVVLGLENLSSGLVHTQFKNICALKLQLVAVEDLHLPKYPSTPMS